MTAEQFAEIKEKSGLSYQDLSRLLGIPMTRVRSYVEGFVEIPWQMEADLYTELPVRAILEGGYEGAAARIKRLRKCLGHSQTSLGDLVGIGPQQISKLETGTCAIRLETVKRISAATTADPFWVMYGARPGRRQGS